MSSLQSLEKLYMLPSGLKLEIRNNLIDKLMRGISPEHKTLLRRTQQTISDIILKFDGDNNLIILELSEWLEKREKETMLSTS